MKKCHPHGIPSSAPVYQSEGEEDIAKAGIMARWWSEVAIGGSATNTDCKLLPHAIMRTVPSRHLSQSTILSFI